jgi:hypothetical protein
MKNREDEDEERKIDCKLGKNFAEWRCRGVFSDAVRSRTHTKNLKDCFCFGRSRVMEGNAWSLKKQQKQQVAQPQKVARKRVTVPARAPKRTKL